MMGEGGKHKTSRDLKFLKCVLVLGIRLKYTRAFFFLFFPQTVVDLKLQF